MAKKDESARNPKGKPAAEPGLPFDQDSFPEKVPDPDWADPVFDKKPDPDWADPVFDKTPDPDWYAGEEKPYPADDAPFTSGDFHNVAQKQILNAVFAILSDTKMEWHLVEPFLAAARDVLLGDIEETAQVRLHSIQQDAEGNWVDSEEAYLGISVSDRDRGEEWLSDTYWLSELAIAEEDPEQVRAIVRALERTIGKLNDWLKDKPSASSAGQPG
jgi:hypothetical protein